MTIGELKEAVAFEAKIPDIDALGGWLDMTIQSVFDEYTAAVKYPELYKSGVITIASAPILPTEVQHLDIQNVQYYPGNDATKAYKLRVNNRATGTNTGPSRYVWREGNSFKLYPNSEVDGSDVIFFNYWKFATFRDGNPGEDVIPAALIQTVIKDTIVRCSMFGDSKAANLYRQLAKEAHGRSLGATEITPMNG